MCTSVGGPLFMSQSIYMFLSAKNPLKSKLGLRIDKKIVYTESIVEKEGINTMHLII